MQKLIELLTDKPLYSKIETEEFYEPSKLHDTKFDFYCNHEKSIKTFNLEIAHDLLDRASEEFAKHVNEERLLNHEGNFSIVQHYTGYCLSCNKYKIEFLLHIYANRPIRKSNGNDKGRKHFISKLGQFPKKTVKLSESIKKYLEEENIELYEKGLMNMENGYGIGAFAYFRRVLETEIKKIVDDIAETSEDRKQKINELKEKYKETRQLSHLYDEIYPFLPSSLKELGNNPISFLYQKLSSGLHGAITEEECLKNAYQINKVFPFVIKKINEEKSEIKDVRDAMKNLE